MTDVKLVFEAARHGDRHALERLLDHYRSRLRAFVNRRLPGHLRGRVDVDDVVQETAFRSVNALARAEWRGESALFGWFCGIALKFILESERRFLRITDSPQSEEGGTGISPSRHVRRKERLDRLHRTLDILNDDERAVIQLIRIDGRSVREASVEIGRSEQATYQLLWRTMKKLKRKFGDTASLRLPQPELPDDSSTFGRAEGNVQ